MSLPLAIGASVVLAITSAIAAIALAIAYRWHRRTVGAKADEETFDYAWKLHMAMACEMEAENRKARSHLEAGNLTQAMESLKRALAFYRVKPWEADPKWQEELIQGKLTTR